MNKIMMKARAGVTLVELLVVILIVTILSVSMLPLLQPFVTEAQYAAEPIPVIGNLRTKIGLYMYDKGHLPASSNALWVLTWKAGVMVTTGTGASATSTSDTEQFGPAYYTLSTSASQTISPMPNIAQHIAQQVDLDYQDLKGKRSRPPHYQYYPLSEKDGSYVIACFGDGTGLKAGTGYAVCELNFPAVNKKYIGTWKRYKPLSGDATQLQFASQAGNNKDVAYCYIPTANELSSTYKPQPGETVPSVIVAMEKMGWEF